MRNRKLELHFAGDVTAELIETRFFGGDNSPVRVTVRGKTAGAYKNAGTFQLSSAVRALCILFVKSSLAHHSPGLLTPPIILGFQGSLAASLDYALTKQPQWLSDMFGSDINGRCIGQRLFHRTNANRKRPGPVVLRANEHSISPAAISIFLNGEEKKDPTCLRELLIALGAPEDVVNPEKKLKVFLEPVAA